MYQQVLLTQGTRGTSTSQAALVAGESFCSLVDPPQEPLIPLSLVSQRFESRSRGTWLMASLSGDNTWGAGSYRVLWRVKSSPLPPAPFRDGCLRIAEGPLLYCTMRMSEQMRNTLQNPQTQGCTHVGVPVAGHTGW